MLMPISKDLSEREGMVSEYIRSHASVQAERPEEDTDVQKK